MLSHIHAKTAFGLLIALLTTPLTLWPAGQAPQYPAAVGASAGEKVFSLASLNDTSRAAYQSARESALRHAGPVLLLEFDVLVLRYGIQRTEVSVSSDRYTTLKSISHIPLAIFALLSPVADTPLDATRLYDLRVYLEQVKQAPASLANHTLDPAQLERQNRMVAECQEFLGEALRSQRVDGKQLDAFTRKLRPLLDENSVDAARAQIKVLDERVRSLRASLTDEDWNRVTVIVLGSQLPRKNNLAVQYFARLLGVPGEGRRIIYAEGLGTEQRALELLGTYLIDTRIGTAFFDDSTRMYRDLLGDAAKPILDEMFKGAAKRIEGQEGRTNPGLAPNLEVPVPICATRRLQALRFRGSHSRRGRESRTGTSKTRASPAFGPCRAAQAGGIVTLWV